MAIVMMDILILVFNLKCFFPDIMCDSMTGREIAGSFEQMEAIHIASTPAELYNAVLVDTPLANYFVDCINEQDLDEMNVELIRNTLYKAYIEDFYKFCKKLGGTTAEVMCEILAFKADRRSIIITI
ncbi:hypothetical protein ANCCAN_24120, partial [Ancylostoma caninum]